MNGLPHRCGRLDRHDAHNWTHRCPFGAPTTYHCTGHVLTEMQLREFDAELDRDEERAIRDRREATA